MAVDLRFFSLFFLSVLDTQLSPRLVLKALGPDFLFALFTVTKGPFGAAIKGRIDTTKFMVFAVSNGAVDLLLDK